MAGDQIQVLLADQDKDVIDIPSLHVIGCNDPYVSGAVALYNMCDRDTAEIFDHGKGHTVPRDARTIQELCDAIERLTNSSTSFDMGDHAGLGGLKVLGAVKV